MDYLDTFYASMLTFLTENKLENRVKGFSEKEINEYEQANGIVFPKAYRLFLSLMAGAELQIFGGRDFTISGLKEAREVSTELLEKDKYEIGSDRFAFSQWQGYNFYHLDLKAENPTVELYIEGGCEGEGSPPEIYRYGVFTDWLCTQIENSLRLRKQLNGLKIDHLLHELAEIKMTTKVNNGG